MLCFILDYVCENLTLKYYNRHFTVPNKVTVAKYSKVTTRYELFSKNVLRVMRLCSIKKQISEK